MNSTAYSNDFKATEQVLLMDCLEAPWRTSTWARPPCLSWMALDPREALGRDLETTEMTCCFSQRGNISQPVFNQKRSAKSHDRPAGSRAHWCRRKSRLKANSGGPWCFFRGFLSVLLCHRWVYRRTISPSHFD